MNRVICRTLLACSASAIAFAGLAAPALAQDATSPPADQTAANADDSQPPAGEIVVTGSLITRRDFKSESPISTIDSSAIKAAGSPSLDGVLGQMPQFAAARVPAKAAATCRARSALPAGSPTAICAASAPTARWFCSMDGG